MLTTIKAVGFTTQSDGTLSAADQGYLSRTWRALGDFDFPMARHPDVDIVNLNQGRDFYTETHPADVVILAHLPSPDVEGMSRANGNNQGVGQVSPFHQRPGVVAQAAERCGAKVIAVFAHSRELDLLPRHAAHYPYFNLVSIGREMEDLVRTDGPLSALLFHHAYLVQQMAAQQIHPHLADLATLRLTRPQMACGQYISYHD